MKSVEELSLAGGLHACRISVSIEDIGINDRVGSCRTTPKFGGPAWASEVVLLVVLVVSRAALTFSLDGETRGSQIPQSCLDSNEERSPLYSSSEHLRWSPGQFCAYFSFILGLLTAYTGETAS